MKWLTPRHDFDAATKMLVPNEYIARNIARGASVSNTP